MKTRTKLGALALSVTLASTLCVPLAFAADPATQPAPADIPITGTIKATTLSVTVPTAIAFDVDPGSYDANKIGEVGTTTGNLVKSGQYTSPTTSTITNLSAVDVYCYVTNVAVTSTAVPTLALVDAPGSITRTGTGASASAGIMFGLASTTEVLSGTTPTDWLKTPSVSAPYFAFSKTTKGKLLAAPGGTPVADGKASISIRGAVAKDGWVEGDAFTITPTFTIATTAPVVTP